MLAHSRPDHRQIEAAHQRAAIRQGSRRRHEPVAGHGPRPLDLVDAGGGLRCVGQQRLHPGVAHVAFESDAGSWQRCAAGVGQPELETRRPDDGWLWGDGQRGDQLRRLVGRGLLAGPLAAGRRDQQDKPGGQQQPPDARRRG